MRQWLTNLSYKPVVAAPYIPNSIVTFMNSPVSFHGYPGTPELDRRLFVISYIQYARGSFRSIFRGLDARYAEMNKAVKELGL